jgi:signal transduction histidine kinase
MTDRIQPDLLAVLVHEVRSPTAALFAIANALETDDVDTGSRAGLVRLALDACKAIERIVLDASYASVEARDVDPGQIVREVVAQAALEGARVEALVAPALPQVSGDDVRLRQALGNLVTNARVHSGADGVIVVGASASGGEVRLFVSDSGSGVPEEEHARILEPGARLDPTRPGSGLGLSIVSAIASAHGGRLSIDSGAGEGSTFTIVLPVRHR